MSRSSSDGFGQFSSRISIRIQKRTHARASTQYFRKLGKLDFRRHVRNNPEKRSREKSRRSFFFPSLSFSLFLKLFAEHLFEEARRAHFKFRRRLCCTSVREARCAARRTTPFFFESALAKFSRTCRCIRYFFFRLSGDAEYLLCFITDGFLEFLIFRRFWGERGTSVGLW